jgi:pilus assembly protein Flp/PilA
MALIKRFLFNTSGATAAEYALLLGILGAAVAVAAFSLGNNISNSLNATSATITDCGGGC